MDILNNEKKLWKAYVDAEKLGDLLILMAKEYGVAILQANLVVEHPRRMETYVVYFETDFDDVLKLFKIHLSNNFALRYLKIERCYVQDPFVERR